MLLHTASFHTEKLLHRASFYRAKGSAKSGGLLYILTCSHLHILLCSHTDIFTSSQTHIFTSSYLHILTSSLSLSLLTRSFLHETSLENWHIHIRSIYICVYIYICICVFTYTQNSACSHMGVIYCKLCFLLILTCRRPERLAQPKNVP